MKRRNRKPSLFITHLSSNRHLALVSPELLEKLKHPGKRALTCTLRVGMIAALLGGRALVGFTQSARAATIQVSSKAESSVYDNPAVQRALAGLGIPTGLGLQTPETPAALPDQFQINTYTTSNQFHTSVAVDSDGDFVVVWQSDGSSGGDSSGLSIQGQRYNSNGTPQGSEFEVNTYTTNNQQNPVVAMDSDGDFIVVWESDGNDTDTSGYSIQGQLYKNSGAPVGSEFLINTYTDNFQQYPAVAMDSNGNFVVVWESDGSNDTDTDGRSIQGQRFANDGTQQGSQFQVNTSTVGYQRHPAVALDNDGDFVIVWEDSANGSDTSSYSIQGQRYNNIGSAQGIQFQINTYTLGDQLVPAVALDSDGDFIVVWQSYNSSGSDTSYESIQGQRFANNGTVQGGEFQVNTYTTNAQRYPAVALDSDGDFVVVWQSDGSSGTDIDYSIQGRVFRNDGQPQLGEFQVNSYTTGTQSVPAVTLDSDGDFVIVWHSFGSNGTDTGSLSIQGHQFDLGQLDYQVNTYTTSHQRFPAVAMDSEGDFVVVWQSNGSTGTDTYYYSIQGQRFNNLGFPQGEQFQVNTYTTSNQMYPAVALDNDGDFVVVWESNGSSGTDTDGFSIQGQRYNNIGVPQGTEFQVNTYINNDQRNPAVAMDSDGDFVVIWESNGSSGTDISGPSIQGQRFNNNGVPQGTEFQINTYITSYQRFPAVAVDSDGDFVVVWESNGSSGTDTDGFSIQGQRYNSIGVPQGTEFQVNTYTFSSQYRSAVATDSAGDFVVIWESNYASGDIDYSSIQGQRYNNSGATQGAQFQVNTYITSTQIIPAVAMDSDGDFVVVWQSYGSSGTDASYFSIQGQRYNGSGVPQGEEFQVNTYTTSSQTFPAVALDSDGDFIAVWQSNGSSGTDTDYSIAASRFTALGGAEPTTITLSDLRAASPAQAGRLVTALAFIVSGWAVLHRWVLRERPDHD